MAQQEDSISYHPITCERVHLQRLDDEDTLVAVRPNALKGLLEDELLNVSILSYDAFVQNRDWAHLTWRTLETNFTHKPVWDTDSYSGNQFSHPYHGSLFYNTAREHGLSYGVSLLYPVLGSASWEYMCETNLPAINDLLSTGIGGAAIGEVGYRTSDIFFDDSRTGLSRVMREIIGTVLNPVRGVHRLFSGEMWRVSRSRGKKVEPEPYSFTIGTGVRSMGASLNEHAQMDVPYFEFDLKYGERFRAADKTSRPWEYFSVHLLANMKSDNPSVGELEILGRIANREIDLPHDWKFDVGMYQALKYLDHYGKYEQNTRDFAIISEAVSFGGGFYAEKMHRRYFLGNELILSGVVLGGYNSDYPAYRRYNFGTGFSVRDNFQFALNRHFLLGDKLYFANLWTPTNITPETVAQRQADNEPVDCMGDAGHTAMLYNTAYLHVNVAHNLRFGVGHTLYFRRSIYKYQPNVTARSHEYKIGLIYSL